MAVLPTYEQVLELPLLLEARAKAKHQDLNGHMSINGYIELHADAGYPFMDMLAMDRVYVEERRLSIMDLEHHLRYLAEIMTGTDVAVHARMLAHNGKLMHGIWFLLDRSKKRLSNTFEFICASVSLESRRTVAFPPEQAALLDQLIATSQKDWDPPISGAMRLR